MMPSLAIYQRYLIRELLAAVFLVLAALLGLFIFFDLITELTKVGKAGYQVGHALMFVAFSIPGHIYELIPLAALIGGLYALSTLARHSEITVLRASGLRTADMLLTLFKAAGLLALLTFIVGEVVVPASERIGRELRATAFSQVIAQQGFVSGLWLKDGRSFINVREARPDGALNGVRIYAFDDEGALTSVVQAESAVSAKTGVWLLERVVATRLEGEVASVEHLDSQAWTTSVTPELLTVLLVAPERMSLFGLYNYIRHLADNKQKTERYEIAVWKKLIYPLTSLVMIALALPFGYSHSRAGGVSLRIFAGVMIGILFYALNGLFSNLGVINAWPPMLSALTPPVLFMSAAAGMLWWVERR